MTINSLQDMSYEALRTFLNFHMYGMIRYSDMMENMFELFQAAVKYQVRDLEKMILDNQVTAENLSKFTRMVNIYKSDRFFASMVEHFRRSNLKRSPSPMEEAPMKK